MSSEHGAVVNGMLWALSSQEELLREVLGHVLGKEAASRMAFDLLKRFGSLPDTLSASSHRLQEVDGVTKEVTDLLKSVKKIAAGMARSRIKLEKPVLSCFNELLDYLHVTMAFEQVEQTRVLFVDKKRRLVADEVLHTGTIDHSPVYPREVLRRALELSASFLILVHNHPSGDPQPSAADLRLTRDLADIAAPLQIYVDDHIIIGKSGHLSFRASGLFRPKEGAALRG